jgi:hypothetical protein
MTRLIAIILLLAGVAGCKKAPTVQFSSAGSFASNASPSTPRLVHIKDCSGRFLRIFEDSRETIELPNPVLTNNDVSLQFYTDSKCIRIDPK